MPLQSPTPVSQSPKGYPSSHTRFQTSQNFDFWQTSQRGQISFNLSQDDSLVRDGISQKSHVLMKGSSFSPIFPFCGNTQQEINCCSQIRPPSFDWNIYQDSDIECVPQYSENIINEFRKNDILYSPRENLFLKQNEITVNDRIEMINWMASTTYTFRLSSRTLFYAVRIFDRLLVVKSIKKEKLLLYATCCLSLASKYNNTYYPQLSEYVKDVNGSFKEDDIVKKEFKVINYLKFQIGCTTQTLFVRYWLNKLEADISCVKLATFIGICSLVSDDLAIIDTELVAVAVVLIALSTFDFDYKKNIFQKEVERFNKGKLMFVMKSIVDLVNIEKENDQSPIVQLFTDYEGDNVYTSYDFTIPEIN